MESDAAPVGWNLETNASIFRFRIDDAAFAHHARRIFAAYVQGQAGPGEHCDAAELIFGELLGNVANHAAGSVEVVLHWHDSHAVLSVYDEGAGYEVPPAALPDNLLSESSRGLYLIAAFGGKELRTSRAPDGRNVTRVVLPVRQRT